MSNVKKMRLTHTGSLDVSFNNTKREDNNLRCKPLMNVVLDKSVAASTGGLADKEHTPSACVKAKHV